MRDFLLRSELDAMQYELIKDGRVAGIMPCRVIRYNDKMKLGVFTDGYEPLERMHVSLDDCCAYFKQLIRLISDLEKNELLYMENIAWNADSLFCRKDGSPGLIYIPTYHVEKGTTGIYIKRVYALLEEVLEKIEGGETMIRQIEYHMEKGFADWNSLANALDKRVPIEDDTIVLKSVNAPKAISFTIGHDEFLIGSQKEADGYLGYPEKIDPRHATVKWNQISFTIEDHGSKEGTFVNHNKIAKGVQVPFGKGSIIRFADLTFNVE